MPDKLIGILGGLGPWATLEIFRRFLNAVTADEDQGYPRLLIYCNSKIPNRIGSILGTGENCVSALTDTAKALELGGADFIFIGSNGTHYYYEEIQRAVSIPVLNMIEETSNYIKKRHHDLEKVGLIAAGVTCSEGIYGKAFENSRFSLVIPNDSFQDKVMNAIFDVKAGRFDTSKQMFIEAGEHLISLGAQLVICGCTEVSVVLREKDLSVPIIDPVGIIVEKAIEISKC
jgi:aspartate racemase